MGRRRLTRERQEVEPVPLNRSWRGWPICYRKLNKHLSACMLCSAQSLPSLHVWGPNSGFKVQPHNLLAKQILNWVAIKYKRERTAVIGLGQCAVNHAQWAGTRWGLVTIVCRFSHNDFTRAITFGWEDRLFTQASMWNETLFMWAFSSPGLLKCEQRSKTQVRAFDWMSLLYNLLFWFLSSWLTVSKCSNNWLLSKFNSSCLVRTFVDGKLLHLLVLLMLFGSPCLWERTVQRSFDWSVCLFELCWHLCVCVCMCAPMSLRVVLASLNAQQVD